MNAPGHLTPILDRLRDVKETNHGWTARCPAHDDEHPSLSINVGNAGAVLVRCFAGCEFDAIAKAIGLSASAFFAPKGAPAPLPAPESPRPPRVYPTVEAAIAATTPRGHEFAAKWPYRGADGEDVLFVVRFNATGAAGAGAKPAKTFRPYHRVAGGYAMGDPAGKHPLFRLPELLAAPAARVFISEGEKKTEALAAIGLLATATAHGAKCPHKSDLRPLAGRDVVIVPDNDDPGRAYADSLSVLLRNLDPPAVVRILHLPDLPEKGDAVEFLADRRARGLHDDAIRVELEALADQVRPRPAHPIGTAAAKEKPTTVVDAMPMDGVPPDALQRCEQLKLELANGASPDLAFDPGALAAAAAIEHGHPLLFAELCNALRASRRLSDWRSAVGAAGRVAQRARALARRDGALPTIKVNDVQLRDLCESAAAALLQANAPTPMLFVRGSLLVRIRAGEFGDEIQMVTATGMLGALARSADWIAEDDSHSLDVKPDKDVARLLVETPPEGLPGLDAIINAPLYAADGTLINSPGFHAEHALYFSPQNSIVVDSVPINPSESDVQAATALLLQDLLCDFPFETPADGAMAVGALIQPFVRRLISGPTPIHVVEAVTPGTGKTTLCSLFAILVTGRPVEVRTLPTDEDEARKKVTAELASGPQIICYDNAPANRIVDSSVLAAAATSTIWKDRLLGFSKNITLPNTALWLLSANNPRFSMELARRCVRIRLDALVERPWERSGFKHSSITDWAIANRGRLVRAVLILVNRWIARGRPASTRRLGSFERWADVVGGILSAAGIDGFLENQEQVYAHADAEGSQWREFTAAWHREFGTQACTIKELLDLAVREHVLEDVVGDGSERSQRTRLGNQIRAQRGRVYGSLRIEGILDSAKRGRTYRVSPTLAPVSAPVAAAPEPVTPCPAPSSIVRSERPEDSAGDLEGDLQTQGPRSQVTPQEEVTNDGGPWGTFSDPIANPAERRNSPSDPAATFSSRGSAQRLEEVPKVPQVPTSTHARAPVTESHGLLPNRGADSSTRPVLVGDAGPEKPGNATDSGSPPGRSASAQPSDDAGLGDELWLADDEVAL